MISVCTGKITRSFSRTVWADLDGESGIHHVPLPGLFHPKRTRKRDVMNAVLTSALPAAKTGWTPVNKRNIAFCLCPCYSEYHQETFFIPSMIKKLVRQESYHVCRR